MSAESFSGAPRRDGSHVIHIISLLGLNDKFCIGFGESHRFLDEDMLSGISGLDSNTCLRSA